MHKFDTTETAIKKFRSNHGDYYDYSHVKYVDSKTKVEVVCPIHGSFWISPNHHNTGRGCKECFKVRKSSQNTKTHDEVISDFISIHGDKYDYTNVVYVDTNTKIKISCPIHGKFEQTPKNHKKGHNCPECSLDKRIPYLGNLNAIERSKLKPAFVYQVDLYMGNETFTKIGVTNNPARRFREFGQYTVINQHVKEFDDMDLAYNHEQSILKSKNLSKYKPTTRFYGSRECFTTLNECII